MRSFHLLHSPLLHPLTKESKTGTGLQKESSHPPPPADGEDVAREHLHAEQEPQIQKETSEQGAGETAGGAYTSRDSPSAQAAQPVGDKSGEEIVAEQGAGATIHPDEAGNAEEGRPMKPPGSAGEGGDWWGEGTCFFLRLRC